MKWPFCASIVAVALSGAAGVQAQPGTTGAQAEALFKQAMELRTAGFDAAACSKFAASKELAPAVGVTLYLADCYERTGRSASAWREFREAERMGRERNDKRADVAAKRAATLEPTLARLTIAPPAQGVKADVVVTVDGGRVPAEFWGNALAVDAGDHIVTVASPGQPPKILTAHVDANTPSAVVHMDEEPPSTPAPLAATADTTLPASAAIGEGSSTGRFAGLGLVVAGAAGIGIGTWLVTDKTRDTMPNGQLCDPHLRAHAIPEGVVAFSAGGVALISGIVLYYVNRPHRTEVSLAPEVVPGGGGALLSGRF